MKRSKLMLLVVGVAFFFFGCEKMDPLVPDSGNDLESNSLKAAKVKTAFNGICTPIVPPPNPGDNAWYDAADDEKVTGTSIWVTEEVTQINETTFELKGTCELTLDEGLGKWSSTWHGCQTLASDGNGFRIVAHAVGTGVEGVVEGMTAKWKYTLDFDGTPATLFYTIKGKISELR